jgi:hypothetical protein
MRGLPAALWTPCVLLSPQKNAPTSAIVTGHSKGRQRPTYLAERRSLWRRVPAFFGMLAVFAAFETDIRREG